METVSFPGVKSGRSVTLTPHPLLVLWSWKSRAIHLLPLWAVRPVQSLSVCTRVHFALPLLSFPYHVHESSLVEARTKQENNVVCSLARYVRITNKLLKQILKTRSQLRSSATCCTIQEGCNYFQKIWEPPQNSLRQAGVMKQVPYWRPVRTRRHRKIISHHGDLALGTCVPLRLTLSKYSVMLVRT
jgi:hypothetical protein